MSKSQIFYTDKYKGIEQNVLKLINAHKDFMSKTTASSPRATGDALQSILADNFQSVLGDLCGTYSSH